MSQDTEREIEASHSDVTVTVHAADVADGSAVADVAAVVGAWDILISNAGYLPEPASVIDSDPSDWWKGFEASFSRKFRLVGACLLTRHTGQRPRHLQSRWDVTELLNKKAEIEGSLSLTANCIGWPYTP